MEHTFNSVDDANKTTYTSTSETEYTTCSTPTNTAPTTTTTSTRLILVVGTYMPLTSSALPLQAQRRLHMPTRPVIKNAHLCLVGVSIANSSGIQDYADSQSDPVGVAVMDRLRSFRVNTAKMPLSKPVSFLVRPATAPGGGGGTGSVWTAGTGGSSRYDGSASHGGYDGPAGISTMAYAGDPRYNSGAVMVGNVPAPQPTHMPRPVYAPPQPALAPHHVPAPQLVYAPQPVYVPQPVPVPHHYVPAPRILYAPRPVYVPGFSYASQQVYAPPPVHATQFAPVPQPLPATQLAPAPPHLNFNTNNGAPPFDNSYPTAFNAVAIGDARPIEGGVGGRPAAGRPIRDPAPVPSVPPIPQLGYAERMEKVRKWREGLK